MSALEYPTEIQENIQSYLFHEGRPCKWITKQNTTSEYENEINEKEVYLCIDTFNDSFGHWVFESAIYLPLFIELKRKYPKCKLWLNVQRSYKFLFTRYFHIVDEDVVFTTNSSPNLCFFPKPIMWLNDVENTLWNAQVDAFIQYFTALPKIPILKNVKLDHTKTTDLCIMPRQTKENAIFCPRTYTITDILNKVTRGNLSYTVLETDTVTNLKDQIFAIQSAKKIIVTDGSPFWVNGIFSRDAHICILGHDCEKLSKEHARYSYLYSCILKLNKSIHTIRYHRPTNGCISDTFTWDDIHDFVTLS